jgi:hypothetical protein
MKLNLGCGNRKIDGFIGVDKYPCDAVDITADITKKLPFDNNSIEEILMDNVIEHISDIVKLMKDLHRICKNNAKITIITPHFACYGSWRDPTHVQHLSYFSLDMFDATINPEGAIHYTGSGFNIVKKKLTFSGGIMGLIGRIIFARSPRKYEKDWCFIFRPNKLTIELKAIKN